MKKYSKTLCLLMSAALMLAGCSNSNTALNQASSHTLSSALSAESSYDTSTRAEQSSEAASSEDVSSSADSSAEASGNQASSEGSSSAASVATQSEPESLPAEVEVLLESMTTEEKVAQLFIVEPEALLNTGGGITAYSGQKFIYPVGGVIFFADNIKTPQQTTDFISALQANSKIPLFVAVDEEGGNVTRIASNPAMGATVFPPMSEIKTEEAAFNVGKTIGTEIRQFGFNMDMAPVADVTTNLELNVMNGRSFGSDPNEVARLVAACVKGFKESGTLCTLKHFPGHGNTVTDSHNGYTELNKTMTDLLSVEFLPFEAGIAAGADFVMLGHLSLPLVTGGNLPATLSPLLVRVLREQLDFDGLIITDSLQMKAITDNYTPDRAAVMAFTAGADVILMPQNLKKAYDGLLAAVKSGEISEARLNESIGKILELKFSSGIIKA